MVRWSRRSRRICSRRHRMGTAMAGRRQRATVGRRAMAACHSHRMAAGCRRRRQDHSKERAMRSITLATLTAASLLAGTAWAAPVSVVQFSQNTGNNDVTIANNGALMGSTGATTISIADATANISQLLDNVTPIDGIDVTLNATSIDNAVAVGATGILQHFNGMFCLSSMAGCGGIVFLSGGFSGAARRWPARAAGRHTAPLAVTGSLAVPETLEQALAEIERLRAEVTSLEAKLAITLGGMHRHQRDEYETISFVWNVPPSGPGHEVSRETPDKED